MPWRSTGCWDVLKVASRSCGHEPDNTHLVNRGGVMRCYKLASELRRTRFLRTSGVLIRRSWSIVTFGACEWEGPPGSIREPGRARHIHWEDPDDHQERPGTCGPRRRGRYTVLRLIRAAAPGRRGRIDPVRRSPPHAPTGDALFRLPLARSTGRVPLRHLGRGDCDRGGRSPPAPTRRRGVLAGGRRERPPGREPLGVTLLLPHLRHPDATRCHPLPRPGRGPLRLRGRLVAAGARRRDPNRGTAHLRRRVVAAAARRRDPDQGRES